MSKKGKGLEIKKRNICRMITIGLVGMMMVSSLIVLVGGAISREVSNRGLTLQQNYERAADGDMVACWHFDENTGTIAYDSSGNGNDGTIYGAAWASGVNGSGLSFDGVDDYVNVSHNNDLNIGGDGKGFTAEAWIKQSGPTSTWQQIIRKGDANAIRYEFKTDSTGTQLRIICYPDGINGVNVDATITADDGNWHYVVFTKSSSDNLLRLYFDGSLKGTSTSTCAGTEGSSDNLCIGCGSGVGEFFNGTIDEVRIYNKALSASEIQAHYEEYAPNLSACWHFDENTGSIAYDSTSNNNDGTIYGASWTTGINGSGLSFDGTDDYVEIPDDIGLKIDDKNFTLEAWVKPASQIPTNKRYAIISRNFPCPADGIETPWLMDLCDDDGQEGYRFGGPGGEFKYTPTSGLISLEWTHFVVTRDLSSNELEMYINGEFKKSYVTTLSILDKPNGVLIGNFNNPYYPNNYFFNGTIDEVSIYNRALSASEIEAHYEEYAVSDGIHWTKYSGNPVLDLGANGEWDDFYVGSPAVIFDGTTYKMWYAGHDGTNNRIGYATSSDGITWTKYSGNPVLNLGAGGTWDDVHIECPSVVFNGTEYKMWYTGNDVANTRIGYAVSSDGITWTKYSGNPVLNLGAGGTWDDFHVGSQSVIFDGTTYKMWYYGYDGTNGRIGYATSSDGITWTKYSGNPVLNVGAGGTWEGVSVAAPSVVFDGTIYRMWYVGHDGTAAHRIGYATSQDGINWTKYSYNPVLNMGNSGSWDDLNIHHPEVVFDGTEYKMWYQGEDGTNRRIGLATSSAGTTFMWTPKTPISVTRSISCAGSVNGKIFVIGGNEPKSGATEINRIDVYYPNNDTWVIGGAATMPAIRTHLSRNAPVIGDRLYVIGGWNGYSPQSTNFVYNITTNTWSTDASMPMALYGMQQTAYNGKIYSFGGDYGGYGGHEQSVVYEYTPSSSGSGSWVTKASIPTPRNSMAVVTFNNKIYVIGGETSGNTPTNAVEVYDPVSNTWETKSSLPFAEGCASGWVLDNMIYVLGGSNKTYRYTPSTDTWDVIGNLPVKSFAEHGIAVFNNYAYVFWGNWSSAWTYQFSVITEKPQEINVAVILAKFNDTPTSYICHKEDFYPVVENLSGYYDANSYDHISFNFTFYDNNTNWYTLPNSMLYYGKGAFPQDKTTTLIEDAVNKADNQVDYAAYDVIIVIHSHQSEQYEGWDDYPATLHSTRCYSSIDGLIESAICLGRTDPVGLWAHELGHSMGVHDRYPVPENYQYGNIGNWSLMAYGCYLPNMLGTKPDHMDSFTKEKLGWINYEDISKSDVQIGMDYSIKYLSKLEYGSNVYRIKVKAGGWWNNSWYIIEARNNTFDDWDNNIPENGIVIYKAYEDWNFPGYINTGVNIVYNLTDSVVAGKPYWSLNMDCQLDHASLRKTGDKYQDAKNGVQFEFVRTDTSSQSYILRISSYTPSDKWGAVLQSYIGQLTGDEYDAPIINATLLTPDLDLHAYTHDGKHVGMNYISGIYENQIDSAIASGDLVGDEEWIFVPSYVEVRYEVSSHDTGEFLEAYPEFAENITEQSFNLTYISFDENGNRFETTPQSYEIVPNTTVEFKTEYRNIDELVANFNAFKGQSVKVNGTVTAVYSDRFFIQNNSYGIMVYTGGNATIAISDKGTVTGVAELVENERSIVYQKFEKTGSETIAGPAINTGDVISTYNEKGSILVYTYGGIKEIGADYITISDGSGNTNIYFKYNITIPTCEIGEILEVTGVLIDSTVGILPVTADSVIVKQPLLSISSSDITFSKLNPADGETIQIYAIVHNNGDTTATGMVKFYNGDPDNGGVWLSPSKIVTVLPGDTKAAFVDWVATDGNHTIYVTVENTITGEKTIASNIINIGIGIQPILVLTTGDINVYRFEPGEERTVSVKATCYLRTVYNVRLVVLDDQGINIDATITPPRTMTDGQTIDFYLRIKAPQLNDSATQEYDIIIQVVGDEAYSNAESMDIIVSESAVSFFSPTVIIAAAAAATAGVVGAIAYFFRKSRIPKI